jgi:hypothetical protein
MAKRLMSLCVTTLLALAVIVFLLCQSGSDPTGSKEHIKDVGDIATTNAPKDSDEKELIKPKSAQRPKAKRIKIENLLATPWSFNPTAKQKVTIRYKLSEKSRVLLGVYGPNKELIKRFDLGERDAGNHSVTWDGKDEKGRVVPDEAYFMRIDAENELYRGYYDPLSHSGGEKVNPRDIHFKPQDNMVSYVLPKASRVLVRAGLQDGPMLNTLLNWIPRGPGFCTEVWTGKDAQGIRRYSERPDALIVVQAYALPENSIIAVGNHKTDYRDYYLSYGQTRPKKVEVERETSLEPITSPHWFLPAHTDKDPLITVSFPGVENKTNPSTPIVVKTDEIIVRVDISDLHSRQFILSQPFELVVFVDDQRLTEAEQAHLPFNWVWDISQLSEGEHLLTINLVTIRQHVGTASQRVRISRSQQEKDFTGSSNRNGDSSDG